MTAGVVLETKRLPGAKSLQHDTRQVIRNVDKEGTDNVQPHEEVLQ